MGLGTSLVSQLPGIAQTVLVVATPVKAASVV
jgi:hypothetical protein